MSRADAFAGLASYPDLDQVITRSGQTSATVQGLAVPSDADRPARCDDASGPRPVVPVSSNGIRKHLADATRPAHLALHGHPLLSRLTDPHLPDATYHLILSKYAAFYATSETRRRQAGIYDLFSLAPDLSRLARDLRDRPEPAAISLPDDAPGLLGMLYVLHGARFGATVIHRNLRRALPDLPHHFFSGRSNPRHWRSLVAELEMTAPIAVPSLTSGAKRTFEALYAFLPSSDQAVMPAHKSLLLRHK